MKPDKYILKSDSFEVHVSNLGATIMHMITLSSAGEPIDVILGFDRVEDYQAKEYYATGAYLGAVIGRYGNRIANGRFTLNDKEFSLAVNNGNNHLHGGLEGFDKKVWTVTEQTPSSVTMTYVSVDGEEGYPGAFSVEVCFSVTGKELHIDYKATTDKDCYVNLTHHPYFNLNPAKPDIKGHMLKLYTDKYLRTEELIPDGSFVTATGPYDYMRPRRLDNIIENYGGLDDCFVFDNRGSLVEMAQLSDEEAGIKLYVKSDYPGLQVYTGRFLDVNNGKGGKHYGAFAGVALEAQYWPDSPNHADFPSTLLKPGEVYRKTTIYGIL